MSVWNSFIGKICMTMLIYMIPVVELRGAIPVGLAHGRGYRTAVAVAIVGNLLPVPFIILFIRRIFRWMKHISPTLRGLVSRLEQRAAEKRGTVEHYKFIGLVLLVAIPLPGTGAWTGALVAAMMDLRLKKAFPAIALGVILAAVLVSFLSYGAGALIFG